jgi:hypothetical protein
MNMDPNHFLNESSLTTSFVSPSNLPKKTIKEKRESHKIVERHRREIINENIAQLAQIVPGSGEKSKGAILASAVQYISQLKESTALMEQHIEVLNDRLLKLSKENEELKMQIN